ncbi:MAG: DUF2027 domain-containing protein [Tannerella sp.]|jgi:hypothetical protein|nr:DUF2027 domain-containing protein [Tannerella sp.]
MKLQIGDKVRFLNSTGGGVVKAFQGKNVVLVEDENGFDFPIQAAECVVIPSGDEALRNSRPAPVEQQPEKPRQPEKPEKRDFVFEETPEGERINAFLAFLPVDPKALMQSSYEAYFINESNYFLYFNYMLRENSSCTIRYSGLIEPNTKLFLEEFPKEDINRMERVRFQMIAFKKDKPFAPKNAYSVDLRIDTVKFYKLHCFTANDYFDENALILPVIVNDLAEKQIHISAEELQEAMMRKKGADEHKSQQPSTHKKPENKPLEVDLHINQLLDNTAGLSNAEMLNCQLDKFRETLRENAKNKGCRIVFIHGKGEGVLRSAIEKELKTRYKSHTYQDASFREYGFGATLVTIH